MPQNNPRIPIPHATIGLVPSKSLPQGQSMVILTFRPVPSHAWRPQSFGLTLDETTRLKKDLSSSLRKWGVCLLVSLVLGCSGRVEVRQEHSAAPTSTSSSAKVQAAGTDRKATEVEFGVFQNPTPEAQPKPEPPPAPAAKPEPAPQVVVVNVIRDESQHVHIHAPLEHRRESVRLHVEVEQEKRADDPECLRAMEAHKARVRRWAEEFRRR